MQWYEQWFNLDYLNLYPHRDEEEAIVQVDALVEAFHLSHGQKLLDLGCGAGRHSIEFAKRGLSVVGLDYSSILIEEAKEKIQNMKGLNPRFVVGDMRDLKGLGSFDVITSLFTSFGYFSQKSDDVRVLNAVQHCLKRGGIFILDYLHPYQVKKMLVSQEKKIVLGEQVQISRKIENDRVIKNIQFPGRNYQESVRLYQRQELETMIKNAKIQVIDVWNDFQGSPWLENGSRQIFICRSLIN